MKNSSIGSALLAMALLASSLTSPQPLDAKTLISQVQSKIEQAPVVPPEGLPVPPDDVSDESVAEPGIAPPMSYVATAYSLRGRTASGTFVRRGIVAADPRVLPLGSRVRLEAGAYSGEYLVADTGGAVRGRKIDIWTSSTREAIRFGRRKVKLTVLSWGPKRSVKKQRQN